MSRFASEIRERPTEVAVLPVYRKAELLQRTGFLYARGVNIKGANIRGVGHSRKLVADGETFTQKLASNNRRMSIQPMSRMDMSPLRFERENRAQKMKPPIPEQSKPLSRSPSPNKSFRLVSSQNIDPMMLYRSRSTGSASIRSSSSAVSSVSRSVSPLHLARLSAGRKRRSGSSLPSYSLHGDDLSVANSYITGGPPSSRSRARMRSSSPDSQNFSSARSVSPSVRSMYRSLSTLSHPSHSIHNIQLSQSVFRSVRKEEIRESIEQFLESNSAVVDAIGDRSAGINAAQMDSEEKAEGREYVKRSKRLYKMGGMMRSAVADELNMFFDKSIEDMFFPSECLYSPTVRMGRETLAALISLWVQRTVGCVERLDSRQKFLEELRDYRKAVKEDIERYKSDIAVEAQRSQDLRDRITNLQDELHHAGVEVDWQVGEQLLRDNENAVAKAIVSLPKSFVNSSESIIGDGSVYGQLSPFSKSFLLGGEASVVSSPSGLGTSLFSPTDRKIFASWLPESSISPMLSPMANMHGMMHSHPQFHAEDESQAPEEPPEALANPYLASSKDKAQLMANASEPRLSLQQNRARAVSQSSQISGISGSVLFADDPPVRIVEEDPFQINTDVINALNDQSDVVTDISPTDIMLQSIQHGRPDGQSTRVSITYQSTLKQSEKQPEENEDDLHSLASAPLEAHFAPKQQKPQQSLEGSDNLDRPGPKFKERVPVAPKQILSSIPNSTASAPKAVSSNGGRVLTSPALMQANYRPFSATKTGQLEGRADMIDLQTTKSFEQSPRTIPFSDANSSNNSRKTSNISRTSNLAPVAFNQHSTDSAISTLDRSPSTMDMRTLRNVEPFSNSSAIESTEDRNPSSSVDSPLQSSATFTVGAADDSQTKNNGLHLQSTNEMKMAIISQNGISSSHPNGGDGEESISRCESYGGAPPYSPNLPSRENSFREADDTSRSGSLAAKLFNN